jgi:hypothetical protein
MSGDGDVVFSAHTYDIDASKDFASCWNKLKDPATRNFAIQFDAVHAHCATNLTEEGVLFFLNSEIPQDVRCLNFWGSEHQTEAIKQVASCYDISPRLATLLCMKTSSKQQTAKLLPPSKNDCSSHRIPKALSPLPATDLEKALSAQTSGATSPTSAKPQNSEVTSFGDVVDNLWHFCSVDWGRRYLYVGLNALFTVPGLEHQQTSSKPAGHRIWISLVLCDDGTVISVFENPPADSAVYLEAVRVVRRNVLNIFRQLSTLRLDNGHDDALMKVNVRPRNPCPPSDRGLQASRTESASLLFYYVFDDWITTYGLIARTEHPYRNKLEEPRTQMFESAEVNLIQSLHLVGRRLTILKLMYQSYDLIVSRMLQRQRFLKSTATPLMPQVPFAIDNDDCFHFNGGLEDFTAHGEDKATNVRLTSSAVVRFERLLDRIRLYALNEIQDCLAEKESLVLMVGVRSNSRVALTYLEFQFGLIERITDSRETHQNHDTASQSYHHFPAGELDDCVLLSPNFRHPESVYSQDLLAMFLGRRARLDIAAVYYRLRK